jgi:threonylcarbamoyladenosine tRNA methylthiotransferase MtaB
MKVHLITYGCKANQYDTETFRQELEARGAQIVDSPEDADACVVNSCTVTHKADRKARKGIRRAKRANPDLKIVVAGCSAARRTEDYVEMDEVFGVVEGHDQVEVGDMIAPEAPYVDHDQEPVGAEVLEENKRRSRGWIKIQDGCDRRCAFCATRLARGNSRSRDPDRIVEEAKRLATHHTELVFTGIHIGHYGRDLSDRGDEQEHTLSTLVARLIEEVPGVRFRLGSVEATEIDDLLIDILENAGDRLVPHLHVPMQSGSNSVLRDMRRWHTREDYRDRVLEIASRLPYLGLGADVMVGFPGETEEDFEQTKELVEELPFTYLHVFPFSQRNGTAAAQFDDQIHSKVKGERSKILREIAQEKGESYRQQRVGQSAEIAVENEGYGMTEDYLRVKLTGNPETRVSNRLYAPLKMNDEGKLTAPV